MTTSPDTESSYLYDQRAGHYKGQPASFCSIGLCKGELDRPDSGTDAHQGPTLAGADSVSTIGSGKPVREPVRVWLVCQGTALFL